MVHFTTSVNLHSKNKGASAPFFIGLFMETDFKNADFTVGDHNRKSRIIIEDGITRMGQTFLVDDAVKTVERLAQQARTNGVQKGAETRCHAVLHEGMLQQIANKHGLTLKQLLFDSNYDDLLWAEATGRDYQKMQISK